MVCQCSHVKHAYTEPTVCSSLDCKCEHYIEAAPDNPIDPKWNSYINEMKTIEDKIGWLLANIKYLRNYNNTEFIDWYRNKVDDKSPESIIRAKRKLVENKPEEFGPFDAPGLVQEQLLKQDGIMEWVHA